MTSFSHLSNPPGQGQLGDTLEQSFASEQLIREDRIERNPNDGSVSLELATRHYYGADDKLMAVQRYSWRGPSLSDGTWEEYWYDALGRRVLTIARRDPSSIYDAMISGPLCMGGIQCRSFTERVWWDGAQALVEQRTPEGTSDVSSSGTIGNIHGLTLDEPLAVITDQTRIVNYNWRGLGQSSVFPNGQAGDAALGNTATEIDWPAATQAQTYFTPGPGSSGSGNPKRWMGTFVANGQGTTGMLYRRNRYFSPTSGQFTQADPIGIGGGMNAFGFAGGDPINYSDPFGLFPCCLLTGLPHSWQYIGVQKAADQVALDFMIDIGSAGFAVTERIGAQLVEKSIARVGTKIQNLCSHLTAQDFRGAARDLKGLESGGQHLKEVTEAAAGLRKQVGNLKNILGNPNISEAERTAITDLLRQASSKLDEANKVIRQP